MTSAGSGGSARGENQKLQAGVKGQRFFDSRGSYVVLVGHNELFHPLLPHLEHLGAFVVEQGELLQHHVLGRLDLGAQVKFRGLGVRLVI